MAIDNITPVASSVLLAGDSVSFIVDDTYTTLRIEANIDAVWENAYISSSGGAQSGYTIVVTTSGGRDTFVVTRDLGWSGDPLQIRVTEDETGTSAATTTSYFLGSQRSFPQGSEPLNPLYEGTLVVTDADVQVRTDVGWIDFTGATVTDLGNGKVRVAITGGSGNDPDAIHDNVAGEITPLTTVTAANADVIIIEDASDGYTKKKVLLSDLLGGSGGVTWATWEYDAVDQSATLPGNGKFKTNNATPGLETEWYVDDDSVEGSLVNFLADLGAGAVIRFTYNSEWATIKISSIVNDTGFFRFVGAYTGASPSFTFADTNVLSFEFIDMGGANDADAIHDNVAGEINALTTVTAAATDVVVIEDASDSFNKKKALVSDFTGGGGLPGGIVAEAGGFAGGTPSAGTFLADNASLNSITAFHISDTLKNGGASLGNFMDTIQAGGKFLVRALPLSVSSVNAFYTIDTVTDQVTYTQYDVTWESGSGTALLGTDYEFFYLPPAAGGAGGGVSPIGTFVYKTPTGLTDPSAGNFRLGNANPNLATGIVISNTNSSAGVDVDDTFDVCRVGDVFYFQQMDDPSVGFSALVTTSVHTGTFHVFGITIVGSSVTSITADKEFGVYRTAAAKSKCAMWQYGSISTAATTTWMGPDLYNQFDNNQNGSYGPTSGDPYIDFITMGKIVPFDGKVVDALSSWRINSATAEATLDLWRFRLVDGSGANVTGVYIGTIATLDGTQSTTQRALEKHTFSADVEKGDLIVALLKTTVAASASLLYSASWSIEAA